MYRLLTKDAFGRLGWKLPLLSFFMLIASILEGVGLTLLLPLLSSFGLSDGDGSERSGLGLHVDNVLNWLGVASNLGAIMSFLVFILVLQVSMTLLVSILTARYTNFYTAEWRKCLFKNIIGANWSYLQNTNTEVQMNQILSETSRNSAALGLALQIVNSSLLILIYAIISWVSSWEIVIGMTLVGLFVYMITRPLSERGHKIGKKVTTVSELLYGRTQEFLHNAKLIKSTATEDVARSMIDKDIDSYSSTYIEAGVLPALIQAIYMWLGYILFGICVWGAVSYLAISPATIIVTMYIFLRLYTQLSNIQQLRQSFLLSAPALENCFNELKAAMENSEHEGSEQHDFENDYPVHITTQNLCVSYAGKNALNQVDFTLHSGDILGITGPSGAGKSTLVDAIVGLVLPSKGMVYIDNTPISSISLADWRQHIGYVAQETLIIKGSVAENISWGNTDATLSEIKQAAELANADEFISKMPQGYDTVIGGRSMKMSGGQRQRLGLARALLGAKKLLILDEATSALDSESEQKVLEAVQRLKGKVSVIMVAHRLSTLTNVDELLVLDDGSISEAGTFEDLSNSDGAFSRLWNIQTTVGK